MLSIYTFCQNCDQENPTILSHAVFSFLDLICFGCCWILVVLLKRARLPVVSGKGPDQDWGLAEPIFLNYDTTNLRKESCYHHPVRIKAENKTIFINGCESVIAECFFLFLIKHLRMRNVWVAHSSFKFIFLILQLIEVCGGNRKLFSYFLANILKGFKESGLKNFYQNKKFYIYNT